MKINIMQKLISIDLFADFGMLKKPDTNEPVYLTFNMLHKPALLGILGAIIGLEGFKEKGKLPEYYEKLKDLKIGIEPLRHENGNFQKSTVKYNNATGLANKSEDNSGATLNIIEQFLIAPAFRCYFLLDTENENHKNIDENLENYHAEYLPYLGKNEFSVWWKEYKKYDEIKDFDFSKEYKIGSVFYKNEAVSSHIAKALSRAMRKELKNRFVYFERLPVSYNEKLFQYEYNDFAYTNARFNTELKIDNVKIIDQQTLIQLF
ncbi:MAG: type I-B CRISPR-associated protein Cas5 [Bacteroidetes bacterium]|nr:MAG: type I-B CRISPR-associated protein Cas5 [Bacteroidota bacterium]